MRALTPRLPTRSRNRRISPACLVWGLLMCLLGGVPTAPAGSLPTLSVSLVYVSGNYQTAPTDSPVPAPLTVELDPGPGFESSPPPVKLYWAVVSGDATFAESSARNYQQTVAMTFEDGDPGKLLPAQASVHVNFGTTPGPVSIRVSCTYCSISGGVSTQQTFNLTSTPPPLTIISGNGQSGALGSAGDAPLVVQFGNPGSPGQTVNWAVTAGHATLSAASSVTDASGQASITFAYGTTAGTVTIQASTSTSQVTFNETAFTPSSAPISGNNQTAVAGSTLQPFVVQVGSPTSSSPGGHTLGAGSTKGVAGIAVTWTVVQGGGTLATTTTTTDSTGRTSNTLTLGPSAGMNVVQASVAGVGTITFTATAVSNVPTGSEFTIVSGNNQPLVPNTPSQPLVVKLATSQGTPISGATIQWSVSGASGKLTSPTTTTDTNGQSQNGLTVILPDKYTVTAQLSDAPNVPALTFSFSNAVANLPGLSVPQQSVAHAIDMACPALAAATSLTTPQKDLLQRCSEIVVGSGTNPDQIPGALDQMLNNKTQPQSSLADTVQQSQLSNLNTRLAELRQGATGVSVRGLTLVDDGRGLPLSSLDASPSSYLDEPASKDEAGQSFDRWGFFLTGMIDRGGASADGIRPGFDFHNASITGGIDYRFNDDFVAGLAFGYNQNRSDLDADVGKINVDGYSLNAYFTWYHNNDFYVEGSAVVDWLDYDLNRNIAYQIASLSGGTTDVSQTATASPSGNQYSLSLSLGKDFNHGAWVASPYARGVYTHLSLDGFSESMSDPDGPGGGLGTSVDSRSFNSMLGLLGGRLSYTASMDWGVLVPNAVFEWNHEFHNNPQTVVTRFLADPTQTPIVLSSPAQDQNFFNIGLGLNAILPQGRSGYFYYEHVAGLAGVHENRFSLGIRIEF
jgi:outer membrane autotransporter protein